MKNPRRKLALVIGISDYEHAPPLRAAILDANNVSSALESIGFLVTKILNQKRAEIKYAVVDFEDSIQPGDMIAFYFSGYGVQWEVSEMDHFRMKAFSII